MLAAKKRVPVGEHALLMRINRALKANGEQMRLCPRNSRWFDACGRYFITAGNTVTAHHCDLTRWALDLGVLKPHKKLEED